ncbi:MAG: hypothetical protein WA517_11240 [Candidatus Acidiferrum sp.]
MMRYVAGALPEVMYRATICVGETPGFTKFQLLWFFGVAAGVPPEQADAGGHAVLLHGDAWHWKDIGKPAVTRTRAPRPVKTDKHPL